MTVTPKDFEFSRMMGLTAEEQPAMCAGLIVVMPASAGSDLALAASQVDRLTFLYARCPSWTKQVASVRQAGHASVADLGVVQRVERRWRGGVVERRRQPAAAPPP